MFKFLQLLTLDFPYIFYFSREILVGRKKNFYTQMHSKFLKGVLAQARPSDFVSTICLCVALVYNSFFFFFKTAVLQKLLDVRFS